MTNPNTTPIVQVFDQRAKNLSAPQAPVRAAALRSIWFLGLDEPLLHDDAREALILGLKDRAPEVRQAAAESLAQFAMHDPQPTALLTIVFTESLKKESDATAKEWLNAGLQNVKKNAGFQALQV